MDFSYNTSAKIKAGIREIEDLRVQLLCVPLSLHHELTFRFEQTITRTYYTFLLSGKNVKREEIKQIVTTDTGRKQSKLFQELLGYKKALDILSAFYIMSAQPMGDVVARKIVSAAGLRIEQETLDKIVKVFEFVSVSHEHPIVQSGIVHAAVGSITRNERIARLLSLLVLYTHGCDFRGLLSLERQFYYDKVMYRSQLEKLSVNSNLTLFLEYYVELLIAELKQLLIDISQTEKRSLAKLIDRHLYLLTYLNNPNARLTNKKVQIMCKVSQITAARDLTHLKNLGFIFTHGKGRAIYYTRV